MHVLLPPTQPPPTTAVGTRILDAATDLFYDRGITATGVDLIVETAGTTKRTLYQRFGSKDGLVAAYLRRRAHQWQTHLTATLDPVEPADALETVYETARSWARRYGRGCAFVNAWAELGPGQHHAVRVIQDEKQWMRALFIQIAASDPLGEALHLVYEGAQVNATIRQDLSPFAIAHTVSRQILRTTP